MRLRTLSFHIAALPALAQAPHFTAREAVRAEWNRTPPTFTAEELAKLPAADRARVELAVQPTGRPGALPLLPTELDHPTQGAWDQKAEEAKTPRERFDALFFLNRFKAKDALKALDGLGATDAKTWPRHLHLEAQVATARLNGSELSPKLQTFLDALQKAGKVDPVRAQAARLRLVMAGKEKELLPDAVPYNPGSLMALMDAWNRGPEGLREKVYKENLFGLVGTIDFLGLGLPEGRSATQGGLPVPPTPAPSVTFWHSAHPSVFGWLQRLYEGLPTKFPDEYLPPIIQSAMSEELMPMARIAAIEALGKSAHPNAAKVLGAISLNPGTPMVIQSALLAPLKRVDPKASEELSRALLLVGKHESVARAAAIEDLSAPPMDLDALTKRIWADDQFESQQTLIQSYARWKMAPEAQKAQLQPWFQHPNWSCRFEAYQALVKLDPATAWPEAPKPTDKEEAILKEAERLAARTKPVRLRITFSDHRVVTMRLDPTVAPINVANLELLAKQRFFDGHLVPRVVPDFVVQMGSPFDTMDGGPGYTVRCEDSLNWYGPGSVGMALAGKDTGGCQFFITTNATPHLTGKYTRAGEVEDLDQAMKILDDIAVGAKIVSIRVVE